MSDSPTISPEDLATSDARLVRTVDGLSEDELAGASLLPGWSRGHVVAHLTLNAEGLERVVTGLRHGEGKTMYDSVEARDQDIADLAGAQELRERFLASVHCLGRALGAMGDEVVGARFERTPGGPTFAVASIPFMRWREVEIHHADLGASYAASAWPAEFSVALIESMTRRDHTESFTVLARDLARTWTFGDEDPTCTLTGDASDLAWWLTGRGDGQALVCDRGDLPTIAPW